MLRRARRGLVLPALALLVPSPVAAAQTRPITGELSRPGYTVLAVSDGGATRVAAAPRRRFTLRPPATRVTLHLRAPDGTYAGPVVLGSRSRGTRVVVGVRSGARLGRIIVNRRRGYAHVATRQATRELDEKRVARARSGVPIGAGNVGYVRTRVAGRTGPGRDQDLDGLPGTLDVDDDGDRVFDSLDRSTSATAAQVTDQFLMSSFLTLARHQTTNANVASLALADADARLAAYGVLSMGIVPGDASELDCGQPQTRSDPSLRGLVYCSTGGTGRVFIPTPGSSEPQIRRFPDEYDLDGDGLGTLTPGSTTPAPGSGQLTMGLHHGAKGSQIGTGDLLIQRVRRGTGELTFPATIEFIFGTVLALASYDDGHGNAMPIDYAQPGGPGSPGSRDNGYPVSAPAGEDIIVTLNLWRPQRTPIGAETAPWIDLGHLNYSVGFEDVAGTCPQDAYIETSDDLRPLESADRRGADYAGLNDLTNDAPAAAGRLLTYKLNLTRCLGGAPFDVGRTLTVFLRAISPFGAAAEQMLSFTRR